MSGGAVNEGSTNRLQLSGSDARGFGLLGATSLVLTCAEQALERPLGMRLYLWGREAPW